jgi:putative Mg2+ transporter-C (MgtC) family protein
MPTILPSLEVTALLRDGGLLFLSWILGGVIGWQREMHGHAAGLRTHALVCGASCLLSLVSFSGHGGDNGRVAAQVVTGIGFLGAGVILRRGASVRGLTTAATVWLVAGVGIAVGTGVHFALLAVVTTILALITLSMEGWKIFRKHSPTKNEVSEDSEKSDAQLISLE